MPHHVASCYRCSASSDLVGAVTTMDSRRLVTGSGVARRCPTESGEGADPALMALRRTRAGSNSLQVGFSGHRCNLADAGACTCCTRVHSHM